MGKCQSRRSALSANPCASTLLHTCTNEICTSAWNHTIFSWILTRSGLTLASSFSRSSPPSDLLLFLHARIGRVCITHTGPHHASCANCWSYRYKYLGTESSLDVFQIIIHEYLCRILSGLKTPCVRVLVHFVFFVMKNCQLLHILTYLQHCWK